MRFATKNQTVMAAYESGRKAAARHLPLTSNPHPPGRQHDWWHKGWMSKFAEFTKTAMARRYARPARKR